MAGKKEAIRDFSRRVSRGKADFFSRYGMDFVMGKREGPWLYDIDGRKKLYNLHCNGGVFNLGHRNAELISILKKAFDSLDIGNHHLMSAERAACAVKITNSMPGDLNVCIFGVSGGESVDLALKIARGHTGRRKIVSARGGYHGHTGLAVLAGDEKYREPFNLENPDFIQVPFGNSRALKENVKSDTAAVILETIPATGGIVLPPENYIRETAQVCEENGALLIIDEVQTGLGRTGKLWSFEHYDIVPDIVVIGKGLSGGIYPITATVIREKLDRIFQEEPFIHISTFGGSEPGCRVASRVMDISSDPGFLNRIEETGMELEKNLRLLVKQHNGIFKGIRRKGLMLGLKLKDEISGPVLTKTAFDNNLLLIYANNDPSVCQMLPPLTMEKTDFEFIINSLDRAFSAAKKLLPVIRLKQKLKAMF